MLDDGSALNVETPEPASEPEPEEKGNRNFLIIGGIFAGLIFLTLVVAAVYFMLIRPGIQNAQISQQATVDAQMAEQIQAMTATAEAESMSLSSPFPTHTQTTMPTATSTFVVVVSTPLASPPVSGPATLEALQTQLAGQMTQTAMIVASEAGGAAPLPTTGFFDEVGLPLLIILTFALLAVILIARRMRNKSI